GCSCPSSSFSATALPFCARRTYFGDSLPCSFSCWGPGAGWDFALLFWRVLCSHWIRLIFSFAFGIGARRSPVLYADAFLSIWRLSGGGGIRLHTPCWPRFLPAWGFLTKLILPY